MKMNRARAAAARRPRRVGDELRAAILKAAAAVFLRDGYSGASIESIIDKVGGSKRAIYSHFGGKKELFAALVNEASSQAVAALSPDEVEKHDLAETLTAFGQQVMRVLMEPTTLALYRAVIAEGTRLPDVAQVFFDNGPGRASKSLAQVLDRFRERGEIQIDDSQRAAEHFVGMLRDDLHLRVVLGLRLPPGEKEMADSVRQAVRIFLRGVGNGTRLRSLKLR